MKDVPDVVGDAEAGVRTLAVRFGGKGVVAVSNALLGAAYVGAAAFFARREGGQYLVAVAHVVIGASLFRKLAATDIGSAASMRSSYMAIWKAFYLEYVILALTLLEFE
jgi:homogentisate phytyltransferase/homogentisate geranylgeranyltransferase